MFNGEIFYTLREAEILIGRWKNHPDTFRPHSSLGYLSPVQAAILQSTTGRRGGRRRTGIGHRDDDRMARGELRKSAQPDPIDSEEGRYIYINGGPLDAGDVIGSQFVDDFDQEWIDAAIEHVTRDGTFEWAPVPGGDFYEAPDQDKDATVENAVVTDISTD